MELGIVAQVDNFRVISSSLLICWPDIVERDRKGMVDVIIHKQQFEKREKVVKGKYFLIFEKGFCV